MKYLKLFEQMDEESWWDEESPFDEKKLLPRLKIGKNRNSCYVLEEIGGGEVRILGTSYTYDEDSEFDSNLILDPEMMIRLHKNDSYIGSCALKDLPKEIKDRL